MTGRRSPTPSAASAVSARLWRLVGAATAVAVLAACAAEPPLPRGAGKPYQINGVWYLPQDDTHYDAVGVASWYGGRHHGRRTASGQVYDMDAPTAAHPTLPFGTRVQVTNLENGRSIVLTINDRGPFVNGRIIDVSRRAAEQLGFLHKGVARVRVRVVASVAE